MKEYAMKAAVRYEIRFTPFVPKYSLIISEAINTNGQFNTPADIFRSSVYPKISRFSGATPIVPSIEKIFAPTISATIAFVRKRQHKNM